MEISLKNKSEAFAEMKEMKWKSMDVILLVARMELEQEAYKVSYKYSGNAGDALSSALNPETDNIIPEIFVFLPGARLVPPDPNSSLTVKLESFTNKDNEIMISDVVISYKSQGLQKEAEYIADVISTTIKP